MASLEDFKLPTNNENNAGKATALDHLGLIAGRLRANNLKWSKNTEIGSSFDSALQPLEEVSMVFLFFLLNFSHFLKVSPMADANELERLISVHQEIAAHLSKCSAEDQSYEV